MYMKFFSAVEGYQNDLCRIKTKYDRNLNGTNNAHEILSCTAIRSVIFK